MFYGLRSEERVVSQVVTLLAYGCPCQAIVAAFGLDERTVHDWQHRAGSHAKAVHEAHIQPLNLQHVQADELRIKLQGRRVVWVAMAIMVSTRLWLGAVISSKRDGQMIGALAALVRGWAQKAALFVAFDGFWAYRDAFEQAFSDPVPHARNGRLVKHVWSRLTLAQVIKRELKGGLRIEHYVLRGSCTMLVYLRSLTQGSGILNTAFIERLNGSFRAYLAPLTRRSHALSRTPQSVVDTVFLFGCVYNFCRLHASLHHATPAMAAQISDHCWSVSELLWHHPCPPLSPSTV
jgi:hypothetical protein